MAKECRYTVHIYDMTMADAIDKLYEEGRYHYKNDLLVDLITIGLAVMTKKEKQDGTAAASKVPQTDRPCYPDEKLAEIEELLDAVAKYIFTQFKALYISQNVTERLLSSIYRQLQEMHREEAAAIKNADAGLYDHLPERFEKIIEGLKKTYGLA